MTDTYKIGSMAEFFDAARKAVQTGTPAEAKIWYGSEKDRREAEAREASAREVESAVKLLCDNLEVTRQIAADAPSSVKALADSTGRSSASLSRTLQKMQDLNIVTMSPGVGRIVAPTLKTGKVFVEFDLRKGNATIVEDRETPEIRHDYHVDIDRLAASKGIKVYIDNSLDDDVSGKIMRSDTLGGASGYAVVVNGRHHRVRQRYTVAHEIAHFELHKSQIGNGITENALYRSAGVSDKQEREANALAAEILMPEQEIRRARAEYATLKDIADAFGVSKEAMSIRLERLHLPY